jgi:hypothetical protein
MSIVSCCLDAWLHMQLGESFGSLRCRAVYHRYYVTIHSAKPDLAWHKLRKIMYLDALYWWLLLVNKSVGVD